MISGLEDTSTVTGKFDYRDENGNPMSIPRYKSLDPTVVITDSSGKQVASGKMPFG
jgi:hypothetical protein